MDMLLFANPKTILENCENELKELFENGNFSNKNENIKIISYNGFKLLIRIDYSGNVQIELKTILKHLSSWNTIDNELKYGSDVKKLTDSLLESSFPIAVFNCQGISKKPIKGCFVNFYLLPFVLPNYTNQLMRFILKDFKDGDEEGIIYFNVSKDKNGNIVKVKVGRTANEKHRLEVYNSDSKKNEEIVDTIDKIEVSKIRKFEYYWKTYSDNNLSDAIKELKTGEYFILSKVKEEREHQYKLIFDVWTSFKHNVLLNFENQT